MDKITFDRVLDSYLTRGQYEEKPITYCEGCGEAIYSADTVYTAENEVFCCTDCLYSYFGIEEVAGYDL